MVMKILVVAKKKKKGQGKAKNKKPTAELTITKSLQVILNNGFPS